MCISTQSPISTSASSIKTRIKTPDSQPLYRLFGVRVHHPLKQGLRHSQISPAMPYQLRTSASSIKTRIKTFLFFFMALSFSLVRVHHPLKQGLRLVKGLLIA